MRHQLRLIAFALGLALIAQSTHVLIASATVDAPSEGEGMTAQSFTELFQNSLPTVKSVVPKKRDPSRQGLTISAASAIVIDSRSGRALFMKAPTEMRPLASISKLMTALVLLDLPLNWSEKIELTEADRTPLGKYYGEPGDVLVRSSVLKMSLGSSANNATRALVRTSGLTEESFIAAMNKKATELGMRAEFFDPVGLDKNNVSNAVGVAKLLRAAMQKEQIRQATTLKKVEVTTAAGKNYSFETTNELLSTFLNRSPYSIIGGKTGFIDEAGYCLAQTVRYQGHDIDVVVLGAKAHELRFKEVKALAYWTFDLYEW